MYSRIVHRPALTEVNMVGRKLEGSSNIDPNAVGLAEGDDGWVAAYLHVHEGKVVEFHEHAKAVTGFKTASKKPLALVEWDAEFRCEDSYVLLDEDTYAKENKEGGWVVLGSDFVRHCDVLRKAKEDAS